MNDEPETIPQAATRREIAERKPQIGEEVTVWVEGRFDVKC